MSVAMQEAVDLIKQADETHLYFIIDFLKNNQTNNNSKEKKMAALNTLYSLREANTDVDNDYKVEYHNYLDDRYKV